MQITSKLSLLALTSNSTLHIGKSAAMHLLPGAIYGGDKQKAISTRGEFFNTAMQGIVEMITSIAGMLFWAIAYVATMGSISSKYHLMRSAACFLSGMSAVGIGSVGAISPELGMRLSSYVLMLPIVLLSKDSTIEQDIYSAIAEICRDPSIPIPANIRNQISPQFIHDTMQGFFNDPMAAVGDLM